MAGSNYEIKTTDLKFKFTVAEILLGKGEGQAPMPGYAPVTFDLSMKKPQK